MKKKAFVEALKDMGTQPFDADRSKTDKIMNYWSDRDATVEGENGMPRKFGYAHWNDKLASLNKDAFSSRWQMGKALAIEKHHPLKKKLDPNILQKGVKKIRSVMADRKVTGRKMTGPELHRKKFNLGTDEHKSLNKTFGAKTAGSKTDAAKHIAGQAGMGFLGGGALGAGVGAVEGAGRTHSMNKKYPTTEPASLLGGARYGGSHRAKQLALVGGSLGTAKGAIDVARGKHKKMEKKSALKKEKKKVFMSGQKYNALQMKIAGEKLRHVAKQTKRGAGYGAGIGGLGVTADALRSPGAYARDLRRVPGTLAKDIGVHMATRTGAGAILGAGKGVIDVARGKHKKDKK